MLAGFEKTLRSLGTDAFLIVKKPNVRYVSSYTGDDSYLLVSESKRFFLTDPRYTEQAAQECPDFELVNQRAAGGLGACIGKLCAENSIKTLAFEADAVNVLTYNELKEHFSGDLVPVTDTVEKLRSVKNPTEIQYLRNACEISCRAFRRLLNDIRVGVTEKELAAKLSLYMVEEGADTQPYGNILISGARTSLLHGIPSEKAVQYGDFVLMDFGCQFNGYLSDMTRTVVVGKATEEQKHVYALEKQMIEDAEKEMRAGASLKKVYEASIRCIKDTKYFPYHYTGIGHGIGMFVHEIPFISPKAETFFEAGNVQTIEPGLYIPGWGGVRIEDQVLITENGYENMISVPHDLIEL